MNFKDKIAELNLPKNSYLVVGSGILNALNIRQSSDIDLVVTEQLYRDIEALGWERETVDDRVMLKNDVFDIGYHWYGEKVEALLKRAQVVDGVPYLSFDDVHTWKRQRGKEKDIRDLRLIEDYRKAHVATIKAVIFDVGGVLIEMNSAARDNIATKLGVDRTQFVAAWKELVLLHGAGKIDEQDFWNQLAKRCNFDPAQYGSSIIGEVFAQQLVIWPNILALAEKLRQVGLVTAILSDTIDAHAKVLRDAGVYDDFSPVLLSYEIGIRKPAPEVFTYTLQTLGIAPDEAIFVDDRPENVEGAESVGIQGIVFRSPEQFEQELRQFIPNF